MGWAERAILGVWCWSCAIKCSKFRALEAVLCDLNQAISLFFVVGFERLIVRTRRLLFWPRQAAKRYKHGSSNPTIEGVLFEPIVPRPLLY